MTPNEYQRLAMRTQCSQSKAFEKLNRQHDKSVPILHSVIGLTGEVGELASAVEKWIYYQQNFDFVNVEEEIGDCLWYLAELCDAMNLSMAEVMENNIAKLAQRYPNKFVGRLAKEENRDREKERRIAAGDYGRTAAREMKEDSLEMPCTSNGCRDCPMADTEECVGE